MPVTSGKEWRSGVEIEFPSGKTALLRPFSFETILLSGYLPDTLTPVVAELMDGTLDSFPMATLEEKKNFFAFINVMCKTCFISPRVVDDPQADDEISIDDIEQADKYHLMSLMNKGAKAMRSFRRKQKGNVGNLDSGEGVPPEA